MQAGGSFALPIKDLTPYKKLAETADADVKDAMTQLIQMLELFWKTPKSTLKGIRHPSGKGTMVPLEDPEIKRIWDAVPYMDELDMFGKRFDKIQEKDLRNAAFHLLWYGRELCLDREPMTKDTL